MTPAEKNFAIACHDVMVMHSQIALVEKLFKNINKRYRYVVELVKRMEK